MPKFIKQRCSPVIIATLILLMSVAACSSNDNAHTTVTTVVPPPQHQVLSVVEVPPNYTAKTEGRLTEVMTEHRPGVDPKKPLLTFNLPDGKTFRPVEVVVIDFSLANAKLRGDGGEYRIRYFVDDDDPRWIDSLNPIGLTGWLPGKHIIRLELIGPDGWPYRNGDQNIITREITVSAQ